MRSIPADDIKAFGYEPCEGTGPDIITCSTIEAEYGAPHSYTSMQSKDLFSTLPVNHCKHLKPSTFIRNNYNTKSDTVIVKALTSCTEKSATASPSTSAKTITSDPDLTNQTEFGPATPPLKLKA